LKPSNVLTRALIVVGITVLVLYLVPSPSPFVALRWLLGAVFLLFLPGYAVTAVLVDDATPLDGVARGLISVGLSVSVVSFIGVFLNFTPWGVTLDTVVAAVAAFTLAFLLYRRYISR
jgi:uncharacterized membrane protein